MRRAAAPDKLTANVVLALGDWAVEEAEEPLAECRVELAARALAELTDGVVVGEGGDPEEEAVPLREAEIAGEALGIVGNVRGVTGQMRLGAAGHDRHGLDGAEEDLSPLGIELSGMLHRATLLVARHPHLGAR